MPRARSNAITTYPRAAAKAVRKYKRRGNRRNKTVKWNNVVKFGTGFPKMAVVTHKYVDTFTIDSTTGAPAGFSFSCNGLYDPNITATGHQPLYFDQMNLIYDHYVVIGSKIKVVAAGNTATSFPVVVGIFVNDDTSVTTGTISAVTEQSSAKPPRMLTGGGQGITMTSKWSAKKYFGGSVLSNTELQGTSTSNPTEQSYFNIYCQSADGTATTKTVFWVEIEYIAVWKELRDIAQS